MKKIRDILKTIEKEDQLKAQLIKISIAIVIYLIFSIPVSYFGNLLTGATWCIGGVLTFTILNIFGCGGK